MVQLPEIKKRNIYLSDQVDQKQIGIITTAIVDINEADNEMEKLANVYGLTYEHQPIMFYIDSYGGHVYQCLGLLGIMKNSKTPDEAHYV